MTTTEDVPVLQSMSIRAFVNRLEEQHSRPMFSSSFTRKPATPSANASVDVDSEEATEPATLAEITPRTLSPLTVLSRSTLTTELNHHEVLRRVNDLIRVKSLNHTVDLETASVECQTACNLSFALFFWYNDQGKVLVEIQRRNGCAILMHRVRKTLFRALLSSNVSATPSNTTRQEEESWDQRCPLHMTVSPRVKQMMERDHEKKQPKEAFQECLERCEEQLGSERYDLHQLAMESLVGMTNPQKSSPCTAEHVAQALLREPKDNEDNHIHYEFVHALRSSTRRRQRESFKYEYLAETLLEDGQQYDKTMAILSLTALYNAINVAKNSTNTSWLDLSSHSWTRIAAALADCLHDPGRHPQEAAMATRCIDMMQEMDSTRTSLLLSDAEATNQRHQRDSIPSTVFG